MIALHHVRKSFDGRVALDDVSLRVDAGATHVLLGSTGSGKSTILKIILGLVRPDSGDVRVEPRARIGYVVQDGALYPHLTVARNVTLPARAAGWSADQQASRLDALARLVGLEMPLLDLYPHQLSSGVGYFLWLWALGNAPATEVTVFLSLSPFTAAVLGALLLAERITLPVALGLGGVGLGLWLAHRGGKSR